MELGIDEVPALEHLMGNIDGNLALQFLRATPGHNVKDDIRLLDLSYRAAKLKARPPIISAIFNMPAEKSRDIYKEVTKESPKKGRMPETEEWFVESADRHMQGTWLCSMYQSHSRDAISNPSKIEALILTYEHYVETYDNPIIHFDRYFFLIRLTFFSNDIKIKNCACCSGLKLEVKRYRHARYVPCPTCHILKIITK